MFFIGNSWLSHISGISIIWYVGKHDSHMKSCPYVIPVKKRDCIVQPTTYTETRLLGGRERERERERDGKFTNNIKKKIEGVYIL